MSLVIGVAAIDADQRWFWSLLVTQQEWTARGWNPDDPQPDAPVAAWIALVPREHDTQGSPVADLCRCTWLARLNAPTLVLGTPLAVALSVSQLVPAWHLLTTHTHGITHLGLLLPMLIAWSEMSIGDFRSFRAHTSARDVSSVVSVRNGRNPGQRFVPMHEHAGLLGAESGVHTQSEGL